jgi:hypothetical protein
MSSADQSGILISSATLSTKYDCFQMCSVAINCVLVSYKASQCMIFNQVKYSVALSELTEPNLFKKYVPDYSAINANLICHWPFNNNLYDVISGANLYGGSGKIT